MSRIILVDDDRTNSTLIKMILEKDGFEVVSCADAPRAIEASSKGADAFIIDCNLAREGDGIELLLSIRMGLTTVAPSIPVVIVSGDDRRKHQAQAANATMFLSKPYSPTDLSHTLRNILLNQELDSG